MNILQALQYHINEIVDDIYDELYYTSTPPLATCRAQIIGQSLSVKIHHPIMINNNWAYIRGNEHSITIILQEGIKLIVNIEQVRERTGPPKIACRTYDLQDPNNTSITDIASYVKELMTTRP